MFRGPFAPIARRDRHRATVRWKARSRRTSPVRFYRVGPDFQYPPKLPNIPFDGEGHVGMFRFSDGHVDYKSRYIRTQRFKAQAAAREALFGTYRNPHSDDPRVTGVSRGTANTAVVFHHGKLLALKEDSPPVALDPDTLATTDDYYTFGGRLSSLTFTAHPKLDPETGEMIAFGYEARGEASDDVAIITIDRHGKLTARTLDQGAVRGHGP